MVVLKVLTPTPVLTLTFKGPPRPGLIPASGDPEHPYRWIRPDVGATGTAGAAPRPLSPSTSPALTLDEATDYVRHVAKTKSEYLPIGPKNIKAAAEAISQSKGGVLYEPIDVSKGDSAVVLAPGASKGETFSSWSSRTSLNSIENLTGIKGQRKKEILSQVRDDMGVLATRSPAMERITGFDERWGDKSSDQGWEADPANSIGGQVIQSAVSHLFEGNTNRLVKNFEDAGISGRRKAYSIDDSVKLADGEIVVPMDQVVNELRDSMEREHTFWKRRFGEDGSIRMYRGIATSNVPDLGTNSSVGYPAESWTTDPSVASRFGNVMLSRNVPIDQIVMSNYSLLSSFNADFMDMQEFVVYTPPDGVEVEVIATKPPDADILKVEKAAKEGKRR